MIQIQTWKKMESNMSPAHWNLVIIQISLLKQEPPVKWTIHAEKSSINGCNYKILLPDFDTECVFEEGDNTIEFTPKKTGIYTYSCWMGMITGKIYVESE